jgi:hypothetical protein
MQKLNAREYYVVVVMTIITIVIAILLYRELFSETSPFITSTDGEFIGMREGYIINIGQNLVQLTLGNIAVLLMLKRKRAGWVAATALLLFYAFIAISAVAQPALAGIMDTIVMIGMAICLVLLLSLVFLCIPSTLKKFNVTKLTLIPLILILGLLVTLNFLIPQ